MSMKMFSKSELPKDGCSIPARLRLPFMAGERNRLWMRSRGQPQPRYSSRRPLVGGEIPRKTAESMMVPPRKSPLRSANCFSNLSICDDSHKHR
jgi:hypothetical protein